jgi:hypothetical protein
MSLKLEDYGFVGDIHTAAQVGINGRLTLSATLLTLPRILPSPKQAMTESQNPRCYWTC